MTDRLTAIVTTVPFGAIAPTPLEALQNAGIEFTINPLGRKLRTEEVADVIKGYDIIVAGTEIISAEAMAGSPELKAICRVGIGLDGVDLLAARKRGVAVSYTPDGPSPAVAELSVGLMVDCLRGVAKSDRTIRAGHWDRTAGKRISLSTVGIIGCGRIGGRLVRHLLGGFPGVQLLVHDIKADIELPNSPDVRRASLSELLELSDVVSMHVPLTPATNGMIGADELKSMKKDAVLLNTARGGIVNEDALAAALNAGTIAAAAVDTFIDEPYKGPLTDCENAILTCHMGSMTEDCRLTMELEACQEAARFAKGEPFATPVPNSEYDMAESLKE